MVSSKEESFSEETNSEYGAGWQQDSDEEDLMSSEGSSRSTHKRKRTSSLPTTHRMNIAAPTYPNVPVVNSFPNPWPWMCPPWMQNPWMYAQHMPMSPPWTMGAHPAAMSYNTPWMQVSPTQWDDYGGNGSQLKKAEKRVKARKHVKNVSNVEQKAKVRKVVKLKKKKRGNHRSSTETKPERLQASQGNGQKKSRLVGSFAARMSALENRQKEIEEKLCEALAKASVFMDALIEFQSKLLEFVVNDKHNQDGKPMQKGRN